METVEPDPAPVAEVGEEQSGGGGELVAGAADEMPGAFTTETVAPPLLEQALLELAATASREMRVMPSPTWTDSRMAPLEPSVRVVGAIPSSSNSSSAVERVPDPGSRSSQAHPQ